MLGSLVKTFPEDMDEAEELWITHDTKGRTFEEFIEEYKCLLSMGKKSEEYQPKDFESLMERKSPLLSTLGKSDYEEIAEEIIRQSILRGRWTQIKIDYTGFAEDMVQKGFLKRVKPLTRRPSRGEIGIYTITQPALEKIMTRVEKRIIRELNGIYGIF